MCTAILRITLLCCLLMAAGPLHAQRIVGRVIDAATEQPIEGAFVTLLNDDGARIAAFLTDSIGRFGFAMANPGVYRIRAERIGHETLFSDPISVPADSTVQVLIRSRTQAIQLPSITAEGEERCVVQSEAAAGAARVWDEVRKALDIAIFTRDRTSLEFESTRYIRELDASLEIVIWDSTEVHTSSGLGRRPFGALDPLALEREGYVQTGEGPDEMVYYGPDEEVLLSDIFLATHCFELVEGTGEAAGRVGLSFRPIRDDGIPDIAGTLWLDRATSELRQIDYRYVQADRYVRVGVASGHTHFRRLPGGFWIVDAWWIRMPNQLQTGDRFHLGSYQEEGGRVLDRGHARESTRGTTGKIH